MDDNTINEKSKKSFYYIFHFPLDDVYNIFRKPEIILSIFLQKAKIISITPNSTLDEIGNTISFTWNNTFNYSLKVENVINRLYFKSFTHKSLYNPPSFSDFIYTLSFFWNSSDKVTIFKFIGYQIDNEHKNIIIEDIYNDKDFICSSIEKYLMMNIKNLEENESISIYKSIDKVWEFISDYNNQKYFFPNDPVKINIIDKENFEVIDIKNQFIYTFQVTKNEDDDDKKELICELVKTENIPKQKVLLNLIRIDDNRCFFIFKHIILEYIPFDTLMSYSTSKKNILKQIKSIIESQKV